MTKRLWSDIQDAEPESVGMSSAGLRRLRLATREDVYKKDTIAGVAHIIIRRGRCVFAQAAGWADRELGRRFSVRTICHLHGATKPLVVAAFLTLLDKGKIALDAEVSAYLPFSEEVLSTRGKRRLPLKSKPTLRHLLTMTAGLEYSDSPAYEDLMNKVRGEELCSLEDFCDALAKVPLQREPGGKHEYSFCTDIIGRICEVVSGQPLDQFVHDVLLKPLQMEDTYFVVPRCKSRRIAALYQCQNLSRPKGCRKHCMKRFVDAGPCAKGIKSAGGGILSYEEPGMWSTARDYARFCQMILNGGVAPGGRRVLRAATVRMLWEDSLAPFAQPDGRVLGWNDFGEHDPEEAAFWDKHVWSLLNSTVEVKQNPRTSGLPRRGRTMWMFGGAGTGWAIDASQDLVAVSFAQNFGGGFWERSAGTGCYSLEFARAAVSSSRHSKSVLKHKQKRP